MKNTQLKGVIVILTMALLFSACSKGSKNITSADALKAYLDSQPANSADKPIKVKMAVNEKMIDDVVKVIQKAGKYVSLDLSGSPLTIIPKYFLAIEHDEGFDMLVGITIPNSVTEISAYAFTGCDSLTSVTFEGTIHKISTNAFNGDLVSKYVKGGPNLGTYTTTAPVDYYRSKWTKQ